MTSRFAPPIDLTDLSDLPGYSNALRPSRKAFVGRVSTKDNQNPVTSIPRQVALASGCLAPGEEFVACFWDVESGMLPPELRGLGPQAMYDALAVPTPRDGGLQDMVERAEQLGITHVVAERSDRLARAMLTSLTVEHELKRIGVEVEYANEPTGGTESGRLRTRRYGQVEAEIYRTNMIEMSTGGQVQHAVQGWNHGYPPYPYIAVIDEDAPNQGRTRYGDERPKRKLAPHPDPRRFKAARELCRLRREGCLKTADIMKVLAADPDKYPIDTQWTRNLVDGLIANPKLTGHQVYNRKATRTGHSRKNPLTDWSWSPTVVHEPVISLQEWKEAQEVTSWLRAGARDGSAVLRVFQAGRRLGITVTAGESSGSHTVYQIGDRRVVLPHPIPDIVVQQIINEMGGPS